MTYHIQEMPLEQWTARLIINDDDDTLVSMCLNGQTFQFDPPIAPGTLMFEWVLKPPKVITDNGVFLSTEVDA